jgi:hypothetical protein
MKKIALCLSGQFRTFEKVFPSIQKHILELYDTDIFIHTWDINTNEDFIKQLPNIKYQIENYSTKRLDFIRNISVFNPYYAGHDPEMVRSMFYSLGQVNQMWKDNDIQYDAIIRSRLDIEYLTPLTLPEILSSNKIYMQCVPKFGNMGGTFELPHMHKQQIEHIKNQLNLSTPCFAEKYAAYPTDIFAYGSYEAMNVYTNISNVFEHYVLVEHMPLQIELLVGAHLNLNQIEMKWDPNLEINIVR